MIAVVKYRAGTGRDGSVVHYVIGDLDGSGNPRPEPPVILKGEPELTIELIKWAPGTVRAFRSFVVSWAPTDNPTEEQLYTVMRAYEVVFFPGMDPDRFAPLYTLHRCKNPHIHIITPAIDLGLGYALDYVGKKSVFDRVRGSFQQVFNVIFRWSDPSGLIVLPDGNVDTKPGWSKKMSTGGNPIGFKEAWDELESSLEILLKWFVNRYNIQNEEIRRWRRRLNDLKLELSRMAIRQQVSNIPSPDRSKNTDRQATTSSGWIHVPDRMYGKPVAGTPKARDPRIRDRAAFSGKDHRHREQAAERSSSARKSTLDRKQRSSEEPDFDLDL